MNKKFLVLSVFSIMLRVLGWLTTIGGAISSGRQAVAYMAERSTNPNVQVNVPWLMQNIAILMTGLLVVVAGEIIGVLFAIERNTRATADIQRGKGSVV